MKQCKDNKCQYECKLDTDSWSFYVCKNCNHQYIEDFEETFWTDPFDFE